MMHLTDRDLIAAYQKGDDAALETLLRRYLGPIYRFLFRMVKDAHTAEDLTQDTFVKVWRNLKRVDPKKDFRSWIYTIAKNTAIDFLRKKPAIPFSDLEQEEASESFAESIPDVRPLPDDQFLQKQSAKELQDLLMRVSPDARSVILLHDVEGMTFQEISKNSRESLNTIKSRYRRAFMALQRMVGQKDPKDVKPKMHPKSP